MTPHRHHQFAVLSLVACCFLWSMSGIVSRQIESASGFETAFWRSLATTLAVAVWLALTEKQGWLKSLLSSGWPGLVSSLMWAVMFTCFMIALSMTTVAKAMVTLAIAPLLTAVLSRWFIKTAIATHTWWAITVAGVGIVWMVSDGLAGDSNYPLSALGMLVAACVPLAAAINLIVMKRTQESLDLVPAILGGAAISTLVCLPLSLPLTGTVNDISWLAFLGIFQIALPCVMYVIAAKYLATHETALITLLEVIFTPLWVWIGVGERPADATLWGGTLVLMALIVNELCSSRMMRRQLRSA
ncbi:MAG: DMT family transporter [Burkholderiaceae bacterium]